MAADLWSQTDALAALATSPTQFDFFQALRLLKHAGIKTQLRNLISLQRAPSPISKVDMQEDICTLWVSFMGLCGTHGVLPEHFTEQVLERLENKDTALADFLDIFNQRILLLLYQAWQDTQTSAALPLLSALCGQPKAVKSHPAISDDSQIYYAGLLSPKVLSHEGLRAILQDYFCVPITLQAFLGEWRDIPASQCTRLSPQQTFNCLGRDAMLGRHIWQLQNRFGVAIGPLNYAQFLQLLPNGDWLQAMSKLITFYVGNEFQFSCKLLLARAEIPPCQLRQTTALQLGWNTWLKSSVSAGITSVSPHNPNKHFHYAT